MGFGGYRGSRSPRIPRESRNRDSAEEESDIDDNTMEDAWGLPRDRVSGKDGKQPTTPSIPMMNILPIAISIISFGFGNKQQVQCLNEEFEGDENKWSRCAIGKILGRNPNRDNMLHEADHRDTRVQNCVFGNPRFGNTVIDQLQRFMEHPLRKLRNTFGCTAGQHRAPVFCSTLECGLNSLKTPSGQRIFNAKHFPLNQARRWNKTREIIKYAQEWVDAPFEPTETSDPHVRASMYGFDGCTGDKVAIGNFNKIIDYLKGPALHDIQPFLEEMASQQAILETDLDDAQGAVEDFENFVDGPDDDDVTPTYVATEFDPVNWLKELKKIGCDETVLKLFFSLAQLGEDGKIEANILVAKLQYKHIRKPSAFMYKCCLNARARILRNRDLDMCEEADDSRERRRLRL